MSFTRIPTHIELMGPLLDALRKLGRSSSPKLVQQEIQKMLGLTEDLLAVKHKKSGQSKFYNNLHWARQVLVWAGLLDNQIRGKWVLTEIGAETILDAQKARAIANKVKEQNRQADESVTEDEIAPSLQESEETVMSLGQKSHGTLARQYWTFSPGEGAELWEELQFSGIMAIGWDDLGDLSFYKNKGEIRRRLQEIWPSDSDRKNDVHACWQFAHDIEVGDVIFAKQGQARLLGCGVVEGNYAYDSTRANYKHVRKVRWLTVGNWQMPDGEKMALKTLTEITQFPDFIKLIAGAMRLQLEAEIENVSGSQPLAIGHLKPTAFTRADALSGLFMSANDLDTILARLKRKKALILQGPPGVGKTFIARRLASPILSEALRGWYCCQGAAENEVGFLNHTILGCGDRF